VAVADERKRARNRCRQAADRRLRRIAGKPDRVAEDPSERNVAQLALGGRTEHTGRWLKTALAEAGALYLPERLHDVRIASRSCAMPAKSARAC
jgi:hypothetical protein